MNRSIAFALAIVALCQSSCSSEEDFTERYVRAVKSGFKVIPESVEMERLFGECDHFISHTPGKKDTWNTVAYFEGRYVLTMQVNVEVKRDFSQVLRTKGEYLFVLAEVESVIPKTGETDFKPPGHFLTIDQWKKIVAAKGDFSVVGITLIRGKPIPNFADFVKGEREPLIPVRPDK